MNPQQIKQRFAKAAERIARIRQGANRSFWPDDREGRINIAVSSRGWRWLRVERVTLRVNPGSHPNVYYQLRLYQFKLGVCWVGRIDN